MYDCVMSRNVGEKIAARGIVDSDVLKTLLREGSRLGPYDCILFGKKETRYGSVTVAGVSVQASRLAWTLEHGEIPDDLTIDHRTECFRSCINTSHLELVTLSENVRRGSLNPFPRTIAPVIKDYKKPIPKRKSKHTTIDALRKGVEW